MHGHSFTHTLLGLIRQDQRAVERTVLVRMMYVPPHTHTHIARRSDKVDKRVQIAPEVFYNASTRCIRTLPNATCI